MQSTATAESSRPSAVAWPTTAFLLLGEVAGRTAVLGYLGRRGGPRTSVGKVEEFRHVGHESVPFRQRRKVETSLNEPQHRGVIHRRMRNVVLLREGRHDEVGNAEAGDVEVERRARLAEAVCAGVEVRGFDAVRIGYADRRLVIESSSAFVEHPEEDRILP